MSFYWDERFLRHLDINSIKVICEIGARYGDESEKLSSIFKDAQILSFECNPILVKGCRERLQKLPNVRFFDFGLGEQNTVMPFYHYTENNDGASSLYKRIDFNNTQKHIGDVVIRTLPSVLVENDIQHVNLVCMDIQGYELNVLRGCGDYFNKIDYVIMEEPKPVPNEYYLPKGVHSSYVGAPTSQEIKAFMNSHNFYEIERVPENMIEDNVMYKRQM